MDWHHRLTAAFRHHRPTLAFAAAVTLGLGCHRRAGEPADERVFTPPPHAATVIQERTEAVRIVGDDGQLLPSTTVVGGLRLPRGLDPVPALSSETRHVYTTHFLPDKLARYFGPMLVTGAVTRIGQGVIYHGAAIRGSSSDARVDVSILPSGISEVRVEVDESSATPSPPLSPEEARRLLERPVD